MVKHSSTVPRERGLSSRGGETRGERKLSASRTSGKGLGELNVRENFKTPSQHPQEWSAEPTLGEKRVYI